MGSQGKYDIHFTQYKKHEEIKKEQSVEQKHCSENLKVFFRLFLPRNRRTMIEVVEVARYGA